MKQDPFEQQLGQRQLPQLPPQWRAEILSGAYAERAEHAVRQRQHRPWLTPSRGGWAALAAVWIVIGLLHLTADSSTVATSSVGPVAVGWQERWREQQQVVAELSESPPAPAPHPSLPSRTRSGSRTRAQLSRPNV